MIFEKFIQTTQDWWHSYFKQIQEAEKRGNLSNDSMTILYPTMLIITKFSGHYTAELIGASREYRGLIVKQHREKSIHRYLNQFDEKDTSSLIHLDAKLNSLRFLTISTNVQLDSLLQRHPQVDLYKSTLMATFDPDCAISFGANFESACIENSTIVNSRGNLYRVKNILALYIFAKNTSRGHVEELFNSTIKDNEVKGVHTIEDSEVIKTITSQLQNMYLQPGLRETTIGEFIKNHPEVVKLAFNTKHFEYEPSLEWLEHDGTCQDSYINPDLIIENDTGHWDIYDLKTALLDKQRITKDSRKRRRFIDYVSEGISQLANYREYFNYEKNRSHALDKYGIKVCNPKLVLVVGNWDNFDPEEVSQASRSLDKSIEIIDYDTLTQLILSGAKRLGVSLGDK